MTSKLLLILLIIGSPRTRDQLIAANQQDREYCPRSKRLSYMHPNDSTRRKVVLDSVNRLLVGQWKLVDIGTRTYIVMPIPEDSIKMSIDRQGNSTVYAQGKRIVDFQLAAGINYGNLRCVISEGGRVYFHLRPASVSDGEGGEAKGKALYGNGLRVCEDYLELYAFTSSGPSYIFKRSTSVRSQNEHRD